MSDFDSKFQALLSSQPLPVIGDLVWTPFGQFHVLLVRTFSNGDVEVHTSNECVWPLRTIQVECARRLIAQQ